MTGVWSWFVLPVASAQGFDAHGLPLAAQDGDPHGTLVVQRPSAFRQGDWFAAGFAEYARSDAALEDVTLRDLVAFNLSAGVAVLDRWRLDLRAPVFGWASGDGQPGVPTFGDVRVTSMWVLARPPRTGGLGLGLIGHVDAPTGNAARLLGQPGWAGGGRLAVTAGTGTFDVTADAGVHLRTPRTDPVAVGGADQLTAGVAVSVAFSESLGLAVEGVTATDFARLAGDAEAGLAVEALASLRVATQRGPFVTVGGAWGLRPDVGTPAYRGFVGVGFARREAPPPPDRDPILALQSTDLCPLERETDNGWRDEDGCPDRLGTLAVDVRYAGESRPANAEIVGPTLTRRQRIGPQGLSLDVGPGTSWTVRATEGCLQGEATAVAQQGGATLVVELAPAYDATVAIEVYDPDGAPVPDAEVTWRSETPDCVPGDPAATDEVGRVEQAVVSGPHTVVVSAPRFVIHEQLVSVLPDTVQPVTVRLVPSPFVVEGAEIQVLEKIRFTVGSSELAPRSGELLDVLVALIVANPDLGRIEVAGHTDARGLDDFNLQLSQARAEAVRDYLTEHGVDPERVVARGYGEDRPVASNKTEEGREQNRRISLHLLDRTEDTP